MIAVADGFKGSSYPLNELQVHTIQSHKVKICPTQKLCKAVAIISSLHNYDYQVCVAGGEVQCHVEEILGQAELRKYGAR